MIRKGGKMLRVGGKRAMDLACCCGALCGFCGTSDSGTATVTIHDTAFAGCLAHGYDYSEQAFGSINGSYTVTRTLDSCCWRGRTHFPVDARRFGRDVGNGPCDPARLEVPVYKYFYLYMRVVYLSGYVYALVVAELNEYSDPLLANPPPNDNLCTQRGSGLEIFSSLAGPIPDCRGTIVLPNLFGEASRDSGYRVVGGGATLTFG